jgi:hypothetical protein
VPAKELRKPIPLRPGPPASFAFWAYTPRSYTARVIMTDGNRTPAFALCRERVIGVDRRSNPPICILTNSTRMRVSSALSAHIAIGDEIAFPIPSGGEIGAEVYITKGAPSSGHSHASYQAPIGYVSHPKLDRRGRHFVSADVQESRLGISAIFLPCESLRDYWSCIHKLPKKTSAAIGTTSVNTWGSWGASSMAQTRELGSKRCDNVWVRRWISLRWRLTRPQHGPRCQT